MPEPLTSKAAGEGTDGISESRGGLEEGDDMAAVSADCEAGGLIACRLSESLDGFGEGLPLLSREEAVCGDGM